MKMLRAILPVVIMVFVSCMCLSAADKELDAILQARNIAITKANDDALKKLEKLMSSKTKKGDLDGALQVKKLIEKIKGVSSETDAGDDEAAANKDKNEAQQDLILSEEGDEEVIASRYVAFMRTLLGNDIDKAVEFVDPTILEVASPAVAKGFLKVMAGGLAIAQITKNDIKVKSVKIGMKGNEAKVVPLLKGEEQKPSYWVCRKGKWYLGDEKELQNFK